MKQGYRWTFFRAGGFDQVKLESGADLLNLENLDQKLWVALACPSTGLEMDARTLALVDSDKDGRVRAPELIAAVKFAGTRLKNADDLLKGSSSLPLASIDDSTPEGKTLLASARQVLRNLGRPDAEALTCDDFADPSKIFADTPFNGDGVVTELTSELEDVRALLREIMDTHGSEQDRSGKPGVSGKQADEFFAEVDAYAAWMAKAKESESSVYPLGAEKTSAAVAAVRALRAKVNDYFGRCRLAAFDPRAALVMNRKEEEYLDVATHDLSLTADEVARFPLAQVAADRPLPLTRGVNPAHAAALAKLREDAIVPLLGQREQLSEKDWLSITEKLAAHDAWLAEKPNQKIEKLGNERILAIHGSNLKQVLYDLIAKDKALEAESASIDQVERLVRYHRDLFKLCENFVNFRDFYDGDEPAIFQCGTLYIDQRACGLCLPVHDAAKHATLAGLAGAYLAYVDCVHKATDEKMQIVTAFTDGDSDNLMVGRNGVFYDRKGRDWDATINKIVDNPISLRQAFWAPYKKFVRMIEEQVAKRAAAADTKAHEHLGQAAEATAQVGNTNVVSAKSQEPTKIDVGAVAALGVAVGAIGTALTAFLGYAGGVLKLGLLATIGAVVGLILLISTPSLVLAYIKLRKRNLGPILDANGWAVNARARINVPFGTTLTAVAKLPPGSRRDSTELYAERGLPWKRWVFLGIVLYLAYGWYVGNFDRFLPETVRPPAVLGKFAPEKKAPSK
ncbi:MAG TPA: hypothetical protein VFQ35_15720 [Polyangiaceae bacterium]|nr:hypothetical protein [Polyangiaceae bacterium]